MNGVRSLPPAHTRSPMWVMLKIFIYNILWLAEYQSKGAVNFNLSDLFFWGQFRRSWKRLNWKNLLLTLETRCKADTGTKNRCHKWRLIFLHAFTLMYSFRSFLCTVHYFLCAFSAKTATYSLVLDNVYFVISS